MKQIVSNYSYSPTTNVVTLTGVNIDQDQLLLVVAPQVGRTMYNFASGVTGVVSAGVNTRVTLNASTAGLTTTSPLVIFYDDQASTQTVAGTVTANGGDFVAQYGAQIPSKLVVVGGHDSANDQILPIPLIDGGGRVGAEITGTVTANVGAIDQFALKNALDEYALNYNVPWPITYANTHESDPLPISGTVTVGNSVTIGSLPAISGTVTARLQDASGNNLTSTSIGGVQRLNVSLASAATAGGTLPSFINIHGGTDGSVARTMLVDSSGRTVVTVSNFPATQNIAGTVTANIYGTVPVSGTFWQATQPVSLASTTVTVSSLPSGALTTRFGSVTTANTAQITSAVTNTSRKYLLAQNISAGTVTIGIGFSPTTTQGIQLTAGGGLTFDTFCPTGAVYWLGAVTGAAFTILEG